jgi:peptide/nickel transport system substrate-binding protein
VPVSPSNDQTIVIANAEPPSSDVWDPHAALGLADNQIWSLVYDTLITYDAWGRLVGCLARRWYRVAPTRLRVELHGDARFSDGTPVTPRDVKASLDRIGDPLSRLVLSAKVVPGLRVDVVDGQTVEIVTPKPFGPIERALAIAAIVPAADVEDATRLIDRPLGSGPFTFAGYDGAEARLVANPRYWRGAPAIEAVVLRYVEDPAQRLEAFLDGRVDVHTRASSTVLDAIATDERFAVTTVGPASQLIYIPQHEGPMADARVRQAIAHAIDRRAIAKSILGQGDAAASSLPRTSIGFQPLKPAFAYNPEEARRLLGEAGCAHGLRLSLASANLFAHQRQIDAFVCESLQAVGIDVELVPLESGVFRKTFHQYSLSFNAIGATSRDPDHLLSFFRPIVAQQALHMDDPLLDGLIEREQQSSGKARLAAINKAAQYLWENQVMISISDDVWHTAVSARVRNYRRTPLEGEPLLWSAVKV